MLEAINNRKAVSEIISYVLLIVIALGISVTIYQWMSVRVPSVSESCPEDISLYVKSYSCGGECYSSTGEGTEKCLNLLIKNNGNFNIDGFFIRASNNISAIPATGLEYTEVNLELEGMNDYKETGRFYFKMMGGGSREQPLAPGEEVPLIFNYQNTIPLKKIQIEPFIESKSSLQICKDATINIEVEDSKGCGEVII